MGRVETSSQSSSKSNISNNNEDKYKQEQLNSLTDTEIITNYTFPLLQALYNWLQE